MVFGGVAEERLELNEDTLWKDGPYDPVNPKTRGALPQMRRLIEQQENARAQALADEQAMARPLSQMAYQVLGNLTLAVDRASHLSAYMVRPNQDWTIAPVASAGGYFGSPYYSIRIAGTDRALAVSEDGLEAETVPRFTGAEPQLWRSRSSGASTS